VVFTHDALTRSGATPATLRSRIAVLNDPRALRSLNAIAALMTADVAAPRPDSGSMLEALLAPFVIALARAQAIPEPSTPHLVSRFEQLLERRFHQEHGVGAYASALGVSADHLSATLRTHCGVSAKSAIERRLFDEAARLLTSTPLTVAAVAYRLGYAEPSHFTRAFRRTCGVSPRRYRETL
jgi:AraC family transcriptional activator of pobA